MSKEQDFIREGLSEAELAKMDSNEAPADTPAREADAQIEGDSRARDEHGRFVKTEAEERAEKAADEPKTVDLRALQEARAEARELRDKHARLEERTNLILEAMNEQRRSAEKPQAVEPPDPDKDIFAAIKYEREQRMELQKQLNDRTQAEMASRLQTDQDTAIWGFWDESARAVAAEKPDFGDAAKFLSDTRVKQLEAYAAVDPAFSNPRQIHATIDNELKHIIVMAAQRGANPAEAVYSLARSFGYQPGNTTGGAVQGQQAPANGNRGGPEAIREAASRQERHMSLSGIQGGEPPKGLDAKALGAMSDKEFQTLMSTAAGRAQLEAVTGIPAS